MIWKFAHLIRRLAVRVVMIAAALGATASLIEYVLEARDFARFTPDQTFATVGASRIRYRMLGVGQPGATVVIFGGMGGSIEQADQLQAALSSEVPTLSYDRAGYGFSLDSAAHTAEEQADELANLLQSLHIERPVLLAAYSASANVARVFAGRYPEKTAAMYLIDPPMPELDYLLPTKLHNTRRYYARSVLHELIASTFGFIRLTQRLHSWRGVDSPVERRADAVLTRRPHYWAQTKEWYESLESARQTVDAQVPPTMPLEIAFPKRIPEDEISIAMTQAYSRLVARSSGGKLTELDFVDHSMILKHGPVFDRMVKRIQELSRNAR